MEPMTVTAAPDAAYAAQETVQIARLDEVGVPFVNDSSRVLVKLDVQAAELSVLRGAERILGLVDAVEAELTVLPLYEGQALLTEIVAFLDDAHFDLVTLEPGFRDPRTGALLQLDGFFVRRHPPDD